MYGNIYRLRAFSCFVRLRGEKGLDAVSQGSACGTFLFAAGVIIVVQQLGPTAQAGAVEVVKSFPQKKRSGFLST
jgi:hypothetical protein